MNKKKWLLIIITAVVLIFVYLKFFYSDYRGAMVPQSADCIALIDVKRIKNTLFWNFITTPSLWDRHKKKNEPEWDKVFDLPDNLYAFHCAGQPANAYYIVLSIKSEDAFSKALEYYGFKKQNDNQYTDTVTGISLYRHGRYIIAGNASVAVDFMKKNIDDLFEKKAFAAKEIISKLSDAKSHVAVYFARGFISGNEFMVTGNFDRDKITLSAILKPGRAFRFRDMNFDYSSGSLLSAGFTQPVISELLADSNYKAAVSKALGVNADSFLLPQNNSYHIDFTGMVSRTDSAITYTYDDDFNRIEKKTVNVVEEPSFRFIMSSPVSQTVFSYLKSTGKIQKTASGNLFLPFPFVRSYCNLAGDTNMIISSDNYRAFKTDQHIPGILFFNFRFDQMPAGDFRYFSAGMRKWTANLENILLTASAADSVINVKAVIEKKKNDLPLFGSEQFQ